jgi:hypothetical protein
MKWLKLELIKNLTFYGKNNLGIIFPLPWMNTTFMPHKSVKEIWLKHLLLMNYLLNNKRPLKDPKLTHKLKLDKLMLKSITDMNILEPPPD